MISKIIQKILVSFKMIKARKKIDQLSEKWKQDILRIAKLLIDDEEKAAREFVKLYEYAKQQAEQSDDIPSKAFYEVQLIRINEELGGVLQWIEATDVADKIIKK